METRDEELLRLLAHVNARPSHPSGLADLSKIAHRSPWDLHRRFHRFVRETPKAYTDRVRLDRAAAELVSTDRGILRIAVENGFASNEVFTRAFKRRFGLTPSAYRSRGLLDGGDDRVAEIHARAVAKSSPCLTLYRTPTGGGVELSNEPINVKELPEQTALVVRCTVARSEIASALGDCLPRAFAEAQRAGLAITGPPFARYTPSGVAMMTIEGGCTIAQAPASPPGDGCEVITLPAGKAAVTIHRGPYDRLERTYTALESWMQAEGHTPAGPSWEVYLTDPGEYPDPETWETEVTQPIA